MLRDLHPDRAAQAYAVVSLWELYPDANPRRPVVSKAQLPDYTALNEPPAVHVVRCLATRPMQIIAEALTEEPRTVEQIAGLTGITPPFTRRFLKLLAKAGRATATRDTRTARVWNRRRSLTIVRYSLPPSGRSGRETA